VLAPGIEISMEALSTRAARPFRVDFSAPETVIAKNTAARLQSGLVDGFAG
jgi:type III pantothenate kinase